MSSSAAGPASAQVRAARTRVARSADGWRTAALACADAQRIAEQRRPHALCPLACDGHAQSSGGAGRDAEAQLGLAAGAFQLVYVLGVHQPLPMHAQEDPAEGSLYGGEREVDVEPPARGMDVGEAFGRLECPYLLEANEDMANVVRSASGAREGSGHARVLSYALSSRSTVKPSRIDQQSRAAELGGEASAQRAGASQVDRRLSPWREWAVANDDYFWVPADTGFVADRPRHVLDQRLEVLAFDSGLEVCKPVRRIGG